MDLITGRTHQIRAHLAHLGFGVLGDRKYGSPSANDRARRELGIRRQMLHAHRVTLPAEPEAGLCPDPSLLGLCVEAPLPDDMAAPARRLGLL